MMTDAELEALYAELLAAVHRADRPTALNLAVAAEAEGLEEPLVLVLAAEALENSAQPGRVVELLERATVVAPGDVETWRRLSLAYNRNDQPERAAAAAERAAGLTPSLATCTMAGAARFALGEFDKARDHYNRARDLAPEAAEPLEGLAAIAARRGEHEAARALAQEALSRAPASVSARLTLARSALAGGAADDADRELTRLLEVGAIVGREAVAMLDLRGDARDALGRFGEAFDDYLARNTLVAAVEPEKPGEIRRLEQAWRLRRELLATDPESLALIGERGSRRSGLGERPCLPARLSPIGHNPLGEGPGRPSFGCRPRGSRPSRPGRRRSAGAIGRVRAPAFHGSGGNEASPRIVLVRGERNLG